MKKLRIGILGGGQLGRMTAQAALKMGHETVVFCDKNDCPASFVVENLVIGAYLDEEKLAGFADLVDVITFEFENIPVKAVEFLEKTHKVYPSSKVLKITQNRLFEKGFLNGIGVETARFAEIKTDQDLLREINDFGNGVLKTATMGYDGKGQFVLRNENDASKAWGEILSKDLLKNQLILEEFCPFESEISVIVARAVNGEIACYEPLTNIHKDGILNQSFYPARVALGVAKKAQEIARKIAHEIGLIGVLAVEFFVMKDEKLLVNELAPRPHNSGHFSMDGAKTSQFEQLVRSVAGYDLGDTKYVKKGFMQNLIGKDIDNLEEFKQNQNARIHLYDKKEAKEGRKMGHVNVIES